MADVTFSHRNGESEPPSEEGWFWFDAAGEAGSGLGMLFVAHDDGGIAQDTWGEYRYTDELVGRWWGPVRPPWYKDVV